MHFIGGRETFHATETSALFALFTRYSSIVSINLSVIFGIICTIKCLTNTLSY
jgi:hypothetical protein